MKKWTRRELLPLVGIGLAGGALLATQRSQEEQNIPYVKLPQLTAPPKLNKGDTIGICAPAGALRRREEVAEFTAILNSMGFQVKVGQNVYEKRGYLAGTDMQRAQDINDFLIDDEVKGIFFLRGGWGCARMLDKINFEVMRESPKVIMGFSDATSLLNAITLWSGVITFHGPSGNSSWNAYSKKYIESVLMSTDLTTFENTQNDHKIVTYVGGEATGRLQGGNLSVLTSMIGTRYFNHFRGALLFLEEVGEEPYRIDRMLTQLGQAGILKECSGVILGNFRKCVAEEPDRSFTLEEVFQLHLSGLNKPVFYGAQIGHTVNKFTIPIGGKAKMNADKGTIELLEAPVQ